jgi:hypothetical protein
MAERLLPEEKDGNCLGFCLFRCEWPKTFKVLQEGVTCKSASGVNGPIFFGPLRKMITNTEVKNEN